MAEQSWHAKLNLLRRQTPATHFLYKPHNFMPANTLLSGLTGQRYSGCFLYMAHRFPSANIFHSGISRPAIYRRPIFLYRANFSLLFAITFHQGAFGAGLNLMASNLSLSFSISFCFFVLYFSCFFLLLSVFLLFSTFSIIQYTEFLFFRIFFADFCTKKTGRISAAGKSGIILQISLQVLLRILLSCRLQ